MEQYPYPADPLPPRLRWFAVWRWRRRWWLAAGLIVLGYIASFGPAVMLVVNDQVNYHALYTVYAPLWWGANRSGAIRQGLESYASLFLGPRVRIVIESYGMNIVEYPSPD